MKLPFPERVLHQHIATLGKTGSGKSSALRVIAEHQLDAKRRLAIVDPKGDWWGLKSSADGKSAGYPVIMFGDFKEPRATDVPINDRSGKQVAELIATGNRPCVLGFRGWMPAQLVRFWLDFAPALFNTNEGELYVIIDEVHNFAPKGKIFDPDAGKCLHWTNRIMSEGRGLGLTFFIASQRPQKVHNDTLDNCETLIAMRVAHPAARQALKDWIDGNGDKERGTEVLNTLAQLKRGEAWVWSPENDFGPDRVQFPMFHTFDSFAPPQLQKKVSQAGWSEVDLDQVKQKLATVIAEAKANDPKELKAEIAKLRVELSKKQVAVAPAKAAAPVVDQKAIERAVQAAVHANREPLLKQLREIHGAIGPVIKATRQLIEVYDALPLAGPKPVFPKVFTPTAAPAPVRIQTPTVRAVPAPTNGNGNGDLSGPQLNLLRRLKEFQSIGKTRVQFAWLAASLGTTARARGFEENVRAVKAHGFAAAAGGEISLTNAGETIAGEVAGTFSVKDKICEMLSGPQAEMFRELDTIYPQGLSLEDLAAQFNTTVRARGFEENTRFLRSNDLITIAHGEAKRSEWIA